MLLSNVYLHYVLDLWFERVVRFSCGKHLVRYIDDFVICFNIDRMHRVQDACVFGWEIQPTLEPTKTKLVEFGRFAQRHAANAVELPGKITFWVNVLRETHVPCTLQPAQRINTFC